MTKKRLEYGPVAVARWFDKTNTIGGWEPAFHSDNLISKFFWLSLFVAGCYFTIVGVKTSIDQYFEYNTLTKLDFDYPQPSKLTLPAVALCHSNRVHCSNLYHVINDTLEEEKGTARYSVLCKLFIYSKCAIALTELDFYNYGRQMWTDICLNFTHPEPEYDTDPEGYGLYQKSPLYFAPEPILPKEDEFNQLFVGLDNGTIDKISHQPSKFVTKCTVHGESTKQCRVLTSSGGHNRYLAPTFGLCYTYNINTTGSEDDMDSARTSGEFAGLELTLNLEVAQSMRNTLTKWMGVRIVLFENDGIPDIYGKGIKVQPGTETNIGVITNRLHKLKTPYKADCKTDWTFGFPYSWQPYSYPTCLEAVKQLGYLKYCKCYVIYGMLNGLIERNPLEFSWCTHDDRHCLKMVDEGFANHSILPTQDCRPRCDSIEFETDISVATWPWKEFTPKAAEMVGFKYLNENITYKRWNLMYLDAMNDTVRRSALNLDRERTADDFAKVNIFFKSMHVKNTIELEEFPSPFSFLASLGGALSLYLGTSLIAVFEIFEFIIRLVLSIGACFF